jgi:hypothetical protein
MAVTQTTRFQLYRWSSGADQFTRAQMTESHDNLEAEGAGYSQAGSRPAAAAEYEGFFHYDSTDSSVGTLSYCNGTAWFDVGAPGSVTSLDGATSDGTSNFFARADHTHALDDSIVTTAKLNDLAVTTGKLDDLAVTTGKIAASAVTNAKLGSDLDASKLTAGTIPAARIGSAAINNDKLASDLSATKLSTGELSMDRIATSAITHEKIEDSAGLSVVGRSANSTGVVADITAASDNQVLRRSGTSIGFGTIATDGIADNAVTAAKIENVAGHSILARVASSTGDLSELAAGTNTVLNRGASGNLQFTSVTNDMLAGGISSGKITSLAATKLTGTIDSDRLPTDIALGTKTTGDYVATVQAGQVGGTDGIDVSVSASEGGTVTIKHHDTSSVSNSNNSGTTVIQDLTFDTYGHVQTVGTTNLTSQFYTESEVDNITNDLYGDSGHTNGRRIYISSTQPAAGIVGNIWFET